MLGLNAEAAAEGVQGRPLAVGGHSERLERDGGVGIETRIEGQSLSESLLLPKQELEITHGVEALHRRGAGGFREGLPILQHAARGLDRFLKV